VFEPVGACRKPRTIKTRRPGTPSLLCFRDVVLRRVDLGKPVNPLRRAHFGRANGCLMFALWFIRVVVVTRIVTVLTVNV
jgi:hypothetical protein